jgi:hypothetical protein
MRQRGREGGVGLILRRAAAAAAAAARCCHEVEFGQNGKFCQYIEINLQIVSMSA